MEATPRTLEALKELSRDLEELQGRAIPEVLAPVDPLQFHREYVSPGRPCIITGAVDEWMALHKWNAEYLAHIFEEALVPVAVTPDGRADAVHFLPGTSQQVFALPAEGQMPMRDFLQHVAASGDGNVLYIQQQNDCLRQEFARLMADIDSTPSWAVAVFGGEPEAVNLWIGGPQSATSFHKDHYENLFVLITGEKTFTLLPPSDVYRLGFQDFPVARFSYEEGANLKHCKLDLKVEDPAANVRWCPMDLTVPPQAGEFPLFYDPELPEPLRVTVRAGQMLYLPSLWHHFVEQTPGPDGVCIAVNMWFDMSMDTKFAHFSLVERLAGIVNE